MTTVAVLADPPVAGAERPSRLAGGPLSTEDATALYRAMLTDVCGAIQRGAADLLVNYRQDEAVPDGVDPEESLRDVLGDRLPNPASARYEVQVGETYAGRVGNTLTHLLENEGEQTVAVVEPTAPFLRRKHVGNAAMKLRSSDVVLGPSPDGRIYFAGFHQPVDFADAFATPAIETLTDRALDAGLDVDFLPMTPLVERPADLATAVSLLRARERAGSLVPEWTAARVEKLGLEVTADGAVAGNS